MKFNITNEIFEKFPGLNIGIVVVKGIDNTGINEEVMEMLKKEQERIKANFSTETLSQQPKIEAWRKAYSSFGAKPKKYKCSVENLYRMIINGIELKHYSKLVDIYNFMSIKHMIPMGGDDLDNIEGGIENGNIILKIAEGNEAFVELNSEETKNPKQGEVVYCDDKEVLCRRWNWRECDKSKMTEQTKNVTLVVEGLPPVTKEEVENIINELAELVSKFCGGEISKFILNQENKEIEF